MGPNTGVGNHRPIESSFFRMVRKKCFPERDPKKFGKTLRPTSPMVPYPFRTKPFRTRDNIVGVGRGHMRMEDIQKLFEKK